MSQADMALVRDSVPGGFNLAVGEPFFLQEVYGPLYPQHFGGKLTYPLLTGDPELVGMLQQRYGGQEVVITNGAKQALLAACHALQTLRNADVDETHDYMQVYHPAPYWPTYPTIADLSGLGFTSGGSAPNTLNILTAPNNPNGSMEDQTRLQWDIWDAAYASRVYGWDYLVPFHRISVWSGAKLYGPSGYRVGWLVTADKRLARLAAEYVEKTTSGVATPSQYFMKGLLKNMASLSPEEDARLHQKARGLLLETSKEFMELRHHFKAVDGVPAHGAGMFAWVQAKDPDDFKRLLGLAKVKVVGGQFLGSEPDWFRVSLGVTPNTMREAVRAIQEVERG